MATIPNTASVKGRPESDSDAKVRSGAMGSSSDDAVVPDLDQPSHETQRFSDIVKMPNGLSEKACKKSVLVLNQCLADTMTLRDMYKKHHWQVVGPTFNQLHLMFDEHNKQQAELVDVVAERIQLLGGISLAMAADVAEATSIERPPRGREPAAVQIKRMAKAHEQIIVATRKGAAEVAEDDPGSEDVLVSQVLRLNELQVWFLTEHLVAASPVGKQ